MADSIASMISLSTSACFACFFDDEPPVEDGDADEVDAGDDAGEGGEDAVDAEGGDDAAAVSAASSE